MEIECSSFRAEALPDGRILLHLEGTDVSDRLTRTEVAAYLRCTPRTVTNYLNRRKDPLPHSLLEGRVYVTRTNLRRWLETENLNHHA